MEANRSLYARHPSDNHCSIIHHSIARWATDYCRVIAIQLFFRRTKVYCILFDELGDLFVSFWLYFKYTGRAYSRSYGQRAFRIAIVHDNGTVLEQHHWGNRAFDKLKYLIPIIGWLIFGLRDAYKAQSKDAEYRTSVDIKNHTVAAVDWSLPSETRFKLK